jgi:actin-binding protein IPP
MVVPRCEFGLCSFGSSLYAFGGWVGQDLGGSIERYCPETDSWCLDGEMPQPTFSMGVVVHKGPCVCVCVRGYFSPVSN